ncbi:hypothetical protein SAMN05660653_02134 [Desulfonatronum thiosulfatophilum]|uniref:Uncharacterized protein n=2 Tax=Desulfonatronum thiosulfatophilum TaxID=617002 RepID=A0A1G6DH97_9BACT|nr:hypothetical protein SAMN05660653_02134 [Desulfonatronum thiosulfatophilum]
MLAAPLHISATICFKKTAWEVKDDCTGKTKPVKIGQLRFKEMAWSIKLQQFWSFQ